MENKQVMTKIGQMAKTYGFNKTLKAIVSIEYQKAVEKNEIVIDSKLYESSTDGASILNADDRNIISDYLSEKSNDETIEFICDCAAMGGIYFENTPIELNNLVFDLLDIHSGDVVCDFGSGNGSFLANVILKAKETENKVEISGTEINSELADISRVLLALLGVDSKNIKNDDILDTKLSGYSKGFTFPPFAIKMLPGSEYRTSRMCPSITFSNRNNDEWIFIDQMLYGLKKGGKAVAFVLGSALFNAQDQQYRDFLLKKGIIESIIELPSNLLPYTGIKIYAIVFSSGNDCVKLVNAQECFVTNSKKKNALDTNKVLELLNSDNAAKKTNKELIGCENLSPSILLLEVKTPYNPKKLGNVSEIIPGCQYTVSHFEELLTDDKDGTRLLTPNDIQNGMIDWDSLRRIGSSDKKMDKFVLKKGDIAITTKSSKVKTAVVDIDSDKKILAVGGILIIRPDLNKINPTYLKIYLDSQDGQCALKQIQKGIVILTISPKRLANLLVPVPDINIQNSKADKYNELLTTLHAYSNEMKKIERKISEFSLEEE